jgi:hypothetical protein
MRSSKSGSWEIGIVVPPVYFGDSARVTGKDEAASVFQSKDEPEGISNVRPYRDPATLDSRFIVTSWPIPKRGYHYCSNF